MGFSMPELAIVLVIALIIFGPGKLPEVGKAVGKGIREFKNASNDLMSDKEKEPSKLDNNTVIDATVVEQKTESDQQNGKA